MNLATRALAFGFPGRTLGRGLELSIAAGEIVALLGPNGSGKTTLLRTLLGLQPPLEGEVLLDHQALDAWPVRERATRLAYVPQAGAVDFEYTVLEIAEMGRAAHHGVFGAPGAADHAAAAEALERLGIAALANRPFSRVSGGERQLALLARAAATGATGLVMDEPAASLDFANQALILEEIARAKARGAAVVFSSHHPDHALRIAERAVLLRDGAILASGPTREVVTSANLSALYGRRVEVVRLESPLGPRDVCLGA